MVAEMHSGFLAVRGELPMNLKQQIELDTTALSSDCLNQIGRIISLWEDCLLRQDNDAFQFGDVSIADVFYAPIVTRFVSYGIEVPERIADYMAAILELNAMHLWYEAALAEQEQIDFVDRRVPVDDTPLNPG